MELTSTDGNVLKGVALATTGDGGWDVEAFTSFAWDGTTVEGTIIYPSVAIGVGVAEAMGVVLGGELFGEEGAETAITLLFTDKIGGGMVMVAPPCTSGKVVV
eukprot:GFYU01045217.1.p2 GENE.GFYU01045217.1~~GFYU01045217.1.p2  ORF type:complete len:103 (+),score=11.60 GFYU01045217.1:507-815(+)